MYDIFSYIRYFHWQNVLDVLLVAYLFYQCSLWVRGSRALLAAVGLAVIGGIALLARWSGLILAGWLFQSLWAVIWLILIIVFQSELRQILERLSLLDFIRGRRSTLHRETLAELTDANAAAIDPQTRRWMLQPATQHPLLETVDLHGAHDFRHTFSTWLEDAGIPARVIDELISHQPCSSC